MEALRNRTLVVSCGVGRDSVAMLVGMHERGLRPAAVVFADVGSEKPGTYAFIPHLREWLRMVEFPDLTIVKYQPKHAPYTTIEGNLVMNATLPGATFNKGSCTLKFKVEPQLRWARTQPEFIKCWARGEKVAKLIGFECDEGYRQKRAADKAHAGKGTTEANRYDWLYPLMEWGWDLEKCIEKIRAAGMPVPPKSACFMCPNQKPHEVAELDDDQRARIMRIELRAEPFNRKVHGLWRRPVKKSGRPGSITEYILREKLGFTPLDQLEATDPMPMNPKCTKPCNGCQELRLADLMRAHGRAVSEKEDESHLGIISRLGAEDLKETP